jgi:hypothetical protein
LVYTHVIHTEEANVFRRRVRDPAEPRPVTAELFNGDHDSQTRLLQPPVASIMRRRWPPASFGAGDERYTELTLWRSKGRLAVWLTYRPLMHAELTTQRIIGWMYRSQFAGFISASLYPWQTPTLGELKAMRKHGMPDILAAATQTAKIARDTHAKMLILATGDLDQTAIADLDIWLAEFRDTWRGEIYCLGRTKLGWPAAIAVTGRRPFGLILDLKPWSYPLLPPTEMTASELHDDDT